MKSRPGLWGVPTRGLSLSQGLLIWDWLVAAVVAVATAYALVTWREGWKVQRWIHAGIVLLSIYLILHAVDRTVQERGMEVTYGYIIFPSLCSVIQRLSEILILFGYSSLSPAFTAGSTDTLDPGRDIPWASLLSILGLYQLGLQFAVCFAWLGAVDLRAINDIATAQSGFYIAYASLQFILTLVVVTIALFKTQEVDDLQTTLEHHGNFEVHDATQMFLSLYWIMQLAGVFLLLRSFCELVIVGHLLRDPQFLLAIDRARDVCYTLFSGISVLLILCGTPGGLTRYWYDDPDPWAANDRAAAHQADVERRAADALHAQLQESLDKWPLELYKQFQQKVKALAVSGDKTAPGVGGVLDSIGDELRRDSPARGGDQRLLQAKLEYLDKTKTAYGDWVPIYKWDGSTRDVEEERDEDIISSVQQKDLRQRSPRLLFRHATRKSHQSR